MTINIENLELILDYTVDKITDERGTYKSVSFKSRKAISQNPEAKLCDSVEILPLLDPDQLTEIEEQIIEKL